MIKRFDPNEEMNYYFTFRSEQIIMKNYYVKFFGTWIEARNFIILNLGANWDSQYSESEFMNGVYNSRLNELKHEYIANIKKYISIK